MSVSLREKTITAYMVDGTEYTDIHQAVKAVLVRALGGYLTGSRESITIDALARATLEPPVVAQLRDLIRALGL